MSTPTANIFWKDAKRDTLPVRRHVLVGLTVAFIVTMADGTEAVANWGSQDAREAQAWLDERCKEREVIKRAVETPDAASLLKVANFLRFSKRMNHRQIFDYINLIAPIGFAEFDGLLYEAESVEP